MFPTSRLLLPLAATALIAAQLPSPALIVLNKEDATLVIVDPMSGKITGTVATGEGPHEMVVAPDKRHAYVGNYGSRTPGNSLSVIDLVEQKEVRRVDLSPLLRPHGIAWQGGKVWFTAEANKLVGRYDPATNKVDYLIGTGQNSTHMVMLKADGTMMVTANIASDSISIFTQEGANWNQTVVPVGKGPEGLDFSPDGGQLWTAHSRDGGVSVIDLAAKKVTHSFDVGTKRSNRIKLSVDGKLALVSDLSGNELVVVDTASRKVTKRIAIGKTPEGILMEPSGAMAYIALAGDGSVAVLDLKTLEVTRRIKTGGGPDGMDWVR